MIQFASMKSKAERRLTKRMNRDNAQILEEIKDPDHPLFMYPTVLVVLILRYKSEFETFEFQYPRICRQLHDYYTTCLSFCFQDQERGNEERARTFSRCAIKAAFFFDDLISDPIVTVHCRRMLGEIRLNLNNSKEFPDMVVTREHCIKRNSFKDVSYWERKFLTTRKYRKQLADQNGFDPYVPTLEYCYHTRGGDPWITLHIIGFA